MVSRNDSLGTVKELMSSHVVALHSGANMHEALEMMVENRVSALPIVDQEDHCVGIITATDLVELTYDIDADLMEAQTVDPSSRRRLVEKLSAAVGQEPVASYASESVASIAESVTLREAARRMIREQIHHLPVVDSDDRLTGILSAMDIVAAVADDG
jgi:CBS domain-containing protein